MPQKRLLNLSSESMQRYNASNKSSVNSVEGRAKFNRAIKIWLAFVPVTVASSAFVPDIFIGVMWVL
jgi:hypothetical protein